jgi:hypothetical protein
MEDLRVKNMRMQKKLRRTFQAMLKQKRHAEKVRECAEKGRMTDAAMISFAEHMITEAEKFLEV